MQTVSDNVLPELRSSFSAVDTAVPQAEVVRIEQSELNKLVDKVSNSRIRNDFETDTTQ
jgi:hypothetical protein